MQRLSLLTAAALALAACENRDALTDEQAAVEALPSENAAIVPESAEAEPSDLPAEPGKLLYRALGTEPGWSLAVREDALLFQGDYGSVRVVERTPPGWQPRTGTLRSGRLTVAIDAGPCSDGMSDHVWRHTVTVTVAGADTARGCGGGVIEQVVEPSPEVESDPLAPEPPAETAEAPPVA